MKPRFAQLKEGVGKVADLLRAIALPFLEHGNQVTVIVDGLDRLIDPVQFREFAEQDLRAVRGMKVSVILAAPLLLWYDRSRFLQDYFDLVKHIPAASVDPKESTFLREILKRRGAGDLMSAASVNEICEFSGGVLRDLLSLAQSAAQNAYREAEDRIARKHVQAAIRQLGNRYLAGIGSRHSRRPAGPNAISPPAISRPSNRRCRSSVTLFPEWGQPFWAAAAFTGGALLNL